MSLAKNLRNLRNEKGITQRELAKLAGVSYSYVLQIEQGAIEPKFKLMKLSNLLGVSIEDLTK